MITEVRRRPPCHDLFLGSYLALTSFSEQSQEGYKEEDDNNDAINIKDGSSDQKGTETTG